MYILDVIAATRIPMAQPQVLSYFFGDSLPPGSLIEIPLGRRKETGIVLESRPVSDAKTEIKKADFEMRGASKIICPESVLTKEQLELAIWLGHYYFAPPGLFLKMMLPSAANSQSRITNGEKQNNEQKLILVPTVEQAQKLAETYKGATLWHSGLRKKQLDEIWREVKNGAAQTVIGTRSAVFLPFSNLKKVKVKDEFHPSHKSWDMFPHYNAADAAAKLAEIFKADFSVENKIPSVRSRFFFGQKNDSAKKAEESQIEIADMRREIKEENFSIFSRSLQKNIKETLKQEKQAVFFINRRGAANFILCRDCGFVAKCQNCDLPLSYHLLNGKPSLFCHHCGFTQKTPESCPKCKSDRLKTVGSGSQKVEIEAKRFFGPARISRLDNDTAETPTKQKKIISDFVEKKSDILIATPAFISWMEELLRADIQISAAISADTILHLPDFQAGERTFQILANLIILTKKSIIQTYNPDSPLFKQIIQNDWKSFFKEEIETRRILGYPPFSQIAKLTFRHKNPQKAGQEAKILQAKLSGINKNPDIEINPALPAFISKERGKYAWNIIIKFKFKNPQFLPPIDLIKSRNLLLQFVPSDWEIDIDPENLL